MELRKKALINPELESLRLKALNSAKTDTLENSADRLISKTSRIHAAFLFHSPRTLQPLLRAIGETSSSAVDLGWQSFGDRLGLDVSILKVINNNHFNHEDPVYNTLLHYVQYEDATIGKILVALKEMGRLDVIMRTKDVLTELSDVIFNHEQELLRSTSISNGSDYGSLPSNDASGEISSDVDQLRNVIIRPELIPSAPFIMKNVATAPLLSSLLLQGMTSSRTSVICSESFSRALATVPFTQAAPVTSLSSCPEVPTLNLHQKYGKKIMLTFAADGAETAQEVSRVFRRQRASDGRIGVLILGEQMRHLNADPFLFISAAFFQVDYVVPIVTEGYLKSVLRRLKEDDGDGGCVDANYVPFIYKLMMTYYTKNGCLNDKVRCLLPDESIDKVCKQLMFVGPLFAVWEKTSCAEQFAQRLLASQA